MNNRYITFSALTVILCSFLTVPGAGQESIYPRPEESPIWANPYPGWESVSPGSAGTRSTTPSFITLYDIGKAENDTELSPTTRSGDLYLSRHPNNNRTGMFQKVNFNTFWSPVGSGTQGLGMTELDLSAMFALPMPTADSPLLLTPKLTTTFFEGKPDWKPTFYTTGLNARWIRPIVKNKFTADLGMSVLYSGDFRVRSSDALRFPAHVAGVWHFNPRTKIVLGVVYSDRRDNYNWFPMAGLIWTPDDDLSVELLVPRMRVAQRIRWFGSAAGDEQSDWLYTAFEFGSGSWGHKPDDFPNDVRTEYSDLRLLLGYERRTRCGLTLGLEVGYMFDRNLVFEHYGNMRPTDSVFLRLRSSF
jgi:hypothetical protein